MSCRITQKMKERNYILRNILYSFIALEVIFTGISLTSAFSRAEGFTPTLEDVVEDRTEEELKNDFLWTVFFEIIASVIIGTAIGSLKFKLALAERIKEKAKKAIRSYETQNALEAGTSPIFSAYDVETDEEWEQLLDKKNIE